MGRKNNADKELEAFGFVKTEDEGFVYSKLVGKDRSVPRERLEPVEGGYLRYIREDGAWRQLPYKVSEKWEKVSGLDFDTQPECFDTVYPEDYIENLYAVANQQRADNARTDK